MIRAAALTTITALTVAACALTATRPPDNNGDTPDTTTTTITVPLAPLPDQTLTAHVATPAVRHEAIQITEPPSPPTTVALPPHYNIWLMLALCESGGDWYINTGNSFYGGLQFTLASWRGAGGEQYASRPHLASVLGQMWTAETLLDMQGWGAWPACARRLGLR